MSDRECYRPLEVGFLLLHIENAIADVLTVLQKTSAFTGGEKKKLSMAKKLYFGRELTQKFPNLMKLSYSLCSQYCPSLLLQMFCISPAVLEVGLVLPWKMNGCTVTI